MKKMYLLMLSALFLASCNAIMMKAYGIKDPELENEKSIKKSALKYDLDTNNIVTVYSREYPKMLTGRSVPDAAIYDSRGKYIEYRQTDTSCNAGLFQFIPDLTVGTLYNQPDSANLASQLVKFRDIRGNQLKEIEKADFYVVIYWAVWTGKLNKDHVKVWEDLAKNNKNAKVKVIKVNLDFQEHWDDADKEKIVGGLKKKK
jgi:hypothetical protein